MRLWGTAGTMRVPMSGRAASASAAKASARGIAVGDGPLIEAGEGRCEDLVGDGCGVSPLLISFSDEGRGLQSGKVPGAWAMMP